MSSERLTRHRSIALLPPVGVERTTLVTLRRPRSARMAAPGARVSQRPLPQSGNALRPSSPRKMPGPTHLLHSVCHSNATHRKVRYPVYIRKLLITWSPLTESNRRPSPYHRWLFDSVTAGRTPDQAEREHRPASAGPRQALASTILPLNLPLTLILFPPVRRSGPGKFTVTVSGTRHFLKPIMRRRAEASGGRSGFSSSSPSPQGTACAAGSEPLLPADSGVPRPGAIGACGAALHRLRTFSMPRFWAANALTCDTLGDPERVRLAQMGVCRS